MISYGHLPPDIAKNHYISPLLTLYAMLETIHRRQCLEIAAIILKASVFWSIAMTCNIGTMTLMPNKSLHEMQQSTSLH